MSPSKPQAYNKCPGQVRLPPAVFPFQINANFADLSRESNICAVSQKRLQAHTTTVTAIAS